MFRFWALFFLFAFSNAADQKCYECIPNKENDYCRRFEWWKTPKTSCENGACMKIVGTMVINGRTEENVVTRFCLPISNVALPLPGIPKGDGSEPEANGACKEYTIPENFETVDFTDLQKATSGNDPTNQDEYLVYEMLTRAQGLSFQRYFIFNNVFLNTLTDSDVVKKESISGPSLIRYPWESDKEASANPNWNANSFDKTAAAYTTHFPGTAFQKYNAYRLDNVGIAGQRYTVCRCERSGWDYKDYCNSSSNINAKVGYLLALLGICIKVIGIY